MNRLSGKVAIITGAALGLCSATAIRMMQEGARVALLEVLDVEGLRLEQNAPSRAAKYWHCDVAREAAVAQVFDEVVRHFGRLDIVVNNAGVSGANKPTHEITEAEWDFVQSINVKGVFFGTKHTIAHLRRAGGGSIINLSSIYGLVGAADVPPYHASKGAVRLMTKNDALTYAPDRIRVNSIHPGFIWTPMVEKHLSGLGDLEAARKAVGALHPLGHMGEPDDIRLGRGLSRLRRSQIHHRRGIGHRWRLYRTVNLSEPPRRDGALLHLSPATASGNYRAARPAFRSAISMAGVASMLAPRPMKKGSASTGILAVEGRSNTVTMQRLPS
jgi:NAD(P)-dependent dehydrogenase (short-subunit alcohol dehydrogenase family)